MKKLSCILVVVTLLMSLVVTGAFATGGDDTHNYHFGFTAGSADGNTYFGYYEHYKKKLSKKRYIEVRHTVTECSAGYTNLIAAHKQSGLYVGSKWMKSNGIYYSTNGGCAQNSHYAPCGRGNTKYGENYSLTSVTISGQFRVH
jgi:hypothetical protein